MPLPQWWLTGTAFATFALLCVGFFGVELHPRAVRRPEALDSRSINVQVDAFEKTSEPTALPWPSSTEDDASLLLSLPDVIRDPILGEAQQSALINQCQAQLTAPRPIATPNAFFMGYRMPDFIIAGFQKCGTSSLAMHLKTENITIRVWELHYFTKYFKYSSQPQPALYASLLHSNEINSSLLLGEKTTEYAFHPQFPHRVVSHNPAIKIILIMRDPVARAFSEYRMRVANKQERRNFSTAVRDEIAEYLSKKEKGSALGLGTHRPQGRYIEHGLYFTQITNILKVVSRCNVHIMVSERFLNDSTRLEELQRIFWFLGVPPTNIEDRGKHNDRARIPRKPRNPSTVDWEWDSPMVQEARHLLGKIFQDENNALFAWLGKPIAEWMNYPSS